MYFLCEVTGTTEVVTYGNFSATATYGNYYYLPWAVTDLTSITFNVSTTSTSNCLYVLLANSTAPWDFSVYPISICGTFATIAPPSADSLGLSPALGSLPASRTYWVSWVNGTISVGAGQVGQGTPVSYVDPVPSAVNYVGFSSNTFPQPCRVSFLVYVPGLPALACPRLPVRYVIW